jgi:hypothetical protein
MMYIVIVDQKVVAECLSSATAGGIVQHYGRGIIAEVLYEAQENRVSGMSRRKPKTLKKPKKRAI